MSDFFAEEYCYDLEKKELVSKIFHTSYEYKIEDAHVIKYDLNDNIIEKYVFLEEEQYPEYFSNLEETIINRLFVSYTDGELESYYITTSPDNINYFNYQNYDEKLIPISKRIFIKYDLEYNIVNIYYHINYNNLLLYFDETGNSIYYSNLTQLFSEKEYKDLIAFKFKNETCMIYLLKMIEER